MKKILSIIAVMILCAAAFAGCKSTPSRVEEVRSSNGNTNICIRRCEDNCVYGHEHHHIKDIEVVTMSAAYDIKIKYDDGHIEAIRVPINSTYIYYANEEDK